MRTIKFRGQTRDTDDWVYGSLIERVGYSPVIVANVELYEYEEIPVMEDTIGQFTGLLDKCGNEIYEGDVLRFNDGSTRPVIWNDRECRFNIVEYGIHLFEVVGNIYDRNIEPADTDITYEQCPHCDNQAKLKAELSVQKCPFCGKHIVSCTMCDKEECEQNCQYLNQANKLNVKGSII